MKRYIITISIFITFLPNAFSQDRHNDLIIGFHSKMRDTFCLNEFIVSLISIRNITEKTVYFYAYHALYDPSGNFISVSGRPTSMEHENNIPKPYDINSCFNTRNASILPSDSAINMEFIGSGCQYGECRNDPFFTAGNYTLKVLVNFSDGSYKRLQRTIYLKNRDTSAFQSTHAYYEAARMVRNADKDYHKHYGRKNLYNFVDTCSNILAKDQMCVSAIGIAGLKDKSDIAFLKKHVYAIRENDILAFALGYVIQNTIADSNVDSLDKNGFKRQKLLQEAILELKKRDITLAYAWFCKLLTWNSESSQVKKCFPNNWQSSHYLTNAEVTELETLLRKR